PESLQSVIDALTEAYQVNDDSVGKLVTESLLALPIEHLTSLNLRDDVICQMLRYSTLISPQATAYLISMTPKDLLTSEEARDFLFGCVKRADHKVLAALFHHGIIVEALYPPNLVALIAAEKGEARQLAMQAIEKKRLTSQKFEATKSDSVQ